ncbi:MAG: histidine kinase [Candidatus Aminicenantes bacterium]|nr:histidine kinase [Candidatus Aminicenantes bacterium]
MFVLWPEPSGIKKVFTFFTLCLTLVAVSTAQNNRISFRHITIEDGLSQSSVYCILRDNKGFMWFGTQDGLNRLDGYHFNVYRNDPRDINSLSDNYINSIWEDHTGQIWVGTRGSGLNMFDPAARKFILYEEDPKNPFSISHNEIKCIFEDHLNQLWIGTNGGGLNRFDRETRRFIHFRNDPNDPNSLSDDHLTCICEDAEGVLWVGTEGKGINRYDRKNKSFARFIHRPNDLSSLSSNVIRCLFLDKSGQLWIGTGDAGIDLFDEGEEIFVHYRHDPNNPTSINDNRVSAIIEDQEGFLWVGTEGSGINRFDKSDGTFSRYKHDMIEADSLSDDTVMSLYEDPSGVLWIGTVGNGINQIFHTEKKFMLYRNTSKNQEVLLNNSIHALYEDDKGFLWIGTRNGLTRMDPSRRHSKHFPADKRNPFGLWGGNIFSICGTSNGKDQVLWVSSFGEGLNRLDVSTDRFSHYAHDPKNPNSLGDNYIYCIYKDHEGILWIGTRSGLDRFDPKTGIFSHYKNDPQDPASISDDYVHIIYEDHQKELWIGTGNGLNMFNYSDETFKRYQHEANNPNSLSNNRVYTICEDSDYVLWIGTQGGGLNRLDRGREKFTFFTEKEGLANNAIYGILEDEKGQLWISTNNGLSRFDPKTSSFKNYDISDSLQSNEFNTGAYFRSRTGEMFFGGINGLNTFFPDQIKDNLYIPPVVITDFKIFNKSIPIGRMDDGRILLKKAINETEEIRLSYRDRAFSFEFAALNYISSEKNHYAYKLEGLSDEWSYIGNRRFVSFTTLPPKTYSLWIKASNNDGVWNEEGTSLKIIIDPPFWKTLWFRGLSALSIMFLFSTFYHFKTVSMRKRNIQLDRKVKERTEELEIANNELKDFAYIVSHDLRAPLRGVSQITTWLSMDYSDSFDKEGKKLVDLLLGRVQRMDNLITGILEYSRAGRLKVSKENIDLDVMIKEIITSLVPPKNIQVKVQKPMPVVKADNVRILQVFQNLISNAIKYMDKPQGEVNIWSSDEKIHWKFGVTDNGPGIEKKDYEKVFKIFQTLEARDRKESTGVGLSLVKKIVERHGGKVWLESEVGKGTTFFFTLPKS